MIVLVGVAHVIDVAKPIGSLVEHYSPGAVGIELDPGRYRALREGSPRGKVVLPYGWYDDTSGCELDLSDAEIGVSGG